MHADPLLTLPKVVLCKIDTCTNSRGITTGVTVRVGTDFISGLSGRVYGGVTRHHRRRLFGHNNHLKIFVALGDWYRGRTDFAISRSKRNHTVALPLPFSQGLSIREIRSTLAARLSVGKRTTFRTSHEIVTDEVPVEEIGALHAAGVAFVKPTI